MYWSLRHSHSYSHEAVAGIVLQSGSAGLGVKRPRVGEGAVSNFETRC